MAALLLSRGVAIIDTLHPVYEGRAFFWAGDKTVETLVSEYGPSTTGNSADTWHQSPFYHLLQGSDNELRHRLEADEPTGFAVHRRAAAGRADRLYRHGAALRQGGGHRRDGLLPLALADTRPGGFSDADLGRASPAGPVAGAGDQVDVAGSRRGHRWSKPTSAAMPAGACLPAAYRGAPSRKSMRSCGSPTSATIQHCRRTWRPTS